MSCVISETERNNLAFTFMQVKETYTALSDAVFKREIPAAELPMTYQRQESLSEFQSSFFGAQSLVCSNPNVLPQSSTDTGMRIKLLLTHGPASGGGAFVAAPATGDPMLVRLRSVYVCLLFWKTFGRGKTVPKKQNKKKVILSWLKCV